MFAQVIQGKTTDAEGLADRIEEWDRNVKPGARGFLGSTGGVSDEGEVIVIARFESEEAARANSDRPEQSQWWADTEKYFDGEPRFYDSTEIEVIWGGGSDDAGFVQVLQGRLKDEQAKNAWREMEAEAEEWMRANRPDVMGSVRAWQGTNFSDFIYFKSEEEARIGEKKTPPPELDPGDWTSQVEDMKFIDLRKPHFSSP